MPGLARLLASLCLTATITGATAWADSSAVGALTSALSQASQADLALKDYIAKPDASFGWKVRQRSRLGNNDCIELTMTSQTWQDITWKHRLFMVIPDTIKQTKDALLVIEGGRWRAKDDQPLAAGDSGIPSKAHLLAGLAEQLGAPLVIVLNVPQQPVFNGKTEDAIIAYTFDKYLTTGQRDWPLLLPMVKSAVRAMDTAQAFLKQDRDMSIENFTVTGASKRGWTTWLTAAADSRVMALAPMVIDMLNLTVQLPHQKASWGEFSPRIHDYTDINFAQRVGTPRGQELVRIVDPYAYRQDITQPKLLLLGTNDGFWTTDALNLYWEGLEGDKYITYVPNADHDLAMDFRRVFGGIRALRLHATSQQSMPKMQWQYDSNEKEVSLTVEPGQESVAQMILWTTQADTRDFRQAKWSPTTITADAQGVYTAKLPRRDQGYAGMYVETVYSRAILPLSLCTTLRIIEPLGQP